MNPVDLFRGTTSFQQGEMDRTHRIWALDFPPPHHFTLTVHRHKFYRPTQWLLSCHGLGLDCWTLFHTDIDKAKVEALQVAGNILKARLNRVNDALAQMAPHLASTPPPDPSAQPPSD